jgi:hypothetical protein
MTLHPGVRFVPLLISGLLLSACGGGQDAAPSSAPGQSDRDSGSSNLIDDVISRVTSSDAPQRDVFWGDTHLHTSYSPDAYLMQNRSADPDTAYRYAKGLPVIHPLHRARVQIGTPLDFLVVSDHAEFMGVVPKIFAGDPLVTNTPTGKRYQEMAAAGNEIKVFEELIAQVNGVVPPNPDLASETIEKTVWSEIMDAADRHNDPGEFTAFMGWEWSSTPGGANLHRVVVMRDGKDKGEQFVPYSSLDSARPEDLWNWLDTTSAATGASFLAIPHNSNISQGLMFPVQDSDGNAITPAWAEQRMRWEPLVEITQIKGDSETHPNLSPTDEFADYETYAHLIAVEGANSQYAFGDGFLGQLSDSDREYLQNNPKIAAQKGDYVRSALVRGLVVEDRIGANPYRMGVIGSTDSHTGIASAEEFNFHGKMALDSTPENKAKDIIPGTPGWDMGAAGLVAVWADENTRESLFDALRRREVYATTGPRIRVRLFAGWDLKPSDLNAADLADTGYTKGVPMGGELGAGADGAAPVLLITAVKDPVDANLDRIQVIKGWVDAEGEPQERVYDVAWSDGREPDADGRLPAVGNTVDITTGSYSNSIGSAQLAAAWTDPEFDASERAFYYVRVLQIPTARHTLLDAIALGIDPAATGQPATIQERAYTSPVWYTPEES